MSHEETIFYPLTNADYISKDEIKQYCFKLNNSVSFHETHNKCD